MKEVSKTGHFIIDLPSSDAATALSGPGNSFLKKFESLTGVSLTIRGLQLEMNGVISKIESINSDYCANDFKISNKIAKKYNKNMFFSVHVLNF